QKFISIPPLPQKPFTGWMNEQELHGLHLGLNGDDAAALLVEQYFADHPRSPSAVRRSKVFRQGETFVVLLGRDVQHGIVGSVTPSKTHCAHSICITTMSCDRRRRDARPRKLG